MQPETFTGVDVPGLLAQARERFGANAVILSVRRVGTKEQPRFELTAADGSTLPVARPRPARKPQRRVTTAPAAHEPKPAPVGAPLTSLWRRRLGTPTVVALVGPTGAGKTTTIAKLARHPQVFGGLPVGLLCLDTYRVGAVEQSRIYADLCGLPFEAVYAREEIAGALKRLKGCEIVLVDTAGRGPRRQADTVETDGLLEALEPGEMHLVLPAGLRADLARRLVTEHHARGATHVLPTKLDELPDDRLPFLLAAEFGLPVRWVTDGQEVPLDIRPASQWTGAAPALAEVG